MAAVKRPVKDVVVGEVPDPRSDHRSDHRAAALRPRGRQRRLRGDGGDPATERGPSSGAGARFAEGARDRPSRSAPTMGMNVNETSVKFLGEVATLPVSDADAGSRFQRTGEPRDGGPKIVSSRKLEIVGNAMNPYSRRGAERVHSDGAVEHRRHEHAGPRPELPIFSGAGLPHNQLAAQIVRGEAPRLHRQLRGRLRRDGDHDEEANFFLKEFESTGALSAPSSS